MDKHDPIWKYAVKMYKSFLRYDEAKKLCNSGKVYKRVRTSRGEKRPICRNCKMCFMLLGEGDHVNFAEDEVYVCVAKDEQINIENGLEIASNCKYYDSQISNDVGLLFW